MPALRPLLASPLKGEPAATRKAVAPAVARGRAVRDVQYAQAAVTYTLWAARFYRVTGMLFIAIGAASLMTGIIISSPMNLLSGGSLLALSAVWFSFAANARRSVLRNQALL